MPGAEFTSSADCRLLGSIWKCDFLPTTSNKYLLHQLPNPEDSSIEGAKASERLDARNFCGEDSLGTIFSDRNASVLPSEMTTVAVGRNAPCGRSVGDTAATEDDGWDVGYLTDETEDTEGVEELVFSQSFEASHCPSQCSSPEVHRVSNSLPQASAAIDMLNQACHSGFERSMQEIAGAFARGRVAARFDGDPWRGGSINP